MHHKHRVDRLAQARDPTQLSDWDFYLHTRNFDALATDLPDLVSPLRPLARQWDRLSSHKTYMLIVPGPHKLDFLTDVPNQQEPPWTVEPETLPRIDAHFWDWMLWLGSKHLRGQEELVQEQLRRLFDHLLGPMGARIEPRDIGSTAAVYNRLRRRREREVEVTLPIGLRAEVEGALLRAGLLPTLTKGKEARMCRHHVQEERAGRATTPWADRRTARLAFLTHFERIHSHTHALKLVLEPA